MLRIALIFCRPWLFSGSNGGPFLSVRGSQKNQCRALKGINLDNDATLDLNEAKATASRPLR